MFLDLAHTKKPVFQSSKQFTLECYCITKNFPLDERFAMVQHIRRAALATHLNITEGCSRKSETERKRYFAIARGSVIEVDAALDIACELNYKSKEQLQSLVLHLVNTYKRLSGLIGLTTTLQVRLLITDYSSLIFLYLTFNLQPHQWLF